MRGHNILQDILKERNQFKTYYTMKGNDDYNNEDYYNRKSLQTSYQIAAVSLIGLIVLIAGLAVWGWLFS